MKRMRTLVVSVAGWLMVAASSQAALTSVSDFWAANPGAGTGEWNLYNASSGNAGIMEHLYGAGKFSRVDDAVDINWAGSPGGAIFDAIYAGAGQALYTSKPPGTPNSTVILSGGGYTGNNAPLRSTTTVAYTPISQPFWFLDIANGNNAYSDPVASSGSIDRMVTFAVTGYLATPGALGSWTAFADGKTRYVIAFEDGTDRDFNDLVVEVSGVTPVPEPTTMIAGALLLLPFAASTVRFMRKNRKA